MVTSKHFGMFYLGKWYPEAEMVRIIAENEIETSSHSEAIDWEEKLEEVDCRDWEDLRESFMEIMAR